MSEPLVSIIVPTFNREDLVLETLESIRTQTYPELELLIIDDGSTDGTMRIAQQWAEQGRARFKSLRVVPNVENRGKSAVVNQGFDLVAGDYVMVFDSDDLLVPEAIAIEMQFLLRNEGVDCVCAGAMLMAGSVKTMKVFHAMSEGPDSTDIVKSYGDLLFRGNPVISSTVLMKRSVVQATGYFDTALRISHDWDYWIRITMRFRMGFVNTPIVHYRINSDGSISQNKYSLFNDVLMVIQKHAARYHRKQVMIMLYRQIRNHLWLSKNDKDPVQMLKILLLGIARTPMIIKEAM